MKDQESKEELPEKGAGIGLGKRPERQLLEGTGHSQITACTCGQETTEHFLTPPLNLLPTTQTYF